MHPLKITLENFTNYAYAELDFTGITLAALAGPTGSGKSSIVDAILWVLYGVATKGGDRALDNYVREGAQECRVTYDWRLQDQDYRAIKLRSLVKGKTLLELFRLTPDGEAEPMSGKTFTETQAKIEALLRMDFNTMTAASLILQGRADSLTRPGVTDGDRKAILARILGLDWWERVQERARDHAKQAKAEAKSLTDQITHDEVKAGRKGAVTVDLVAQEQALTVAAAQSAEVGQRVAELEAKVRQRPILQQQLQDIDGQLAARARDRQQADQDRAEAQAEVSRQETLLGRPATIERQIPVAGQALKDATAATEVATAKAGELDAKVRMADAVQKQLDDIDGQMAARKADQESIKREGAIARQQLDAQNAIVSRADAIRQAAAEATVMNAQLTEMDAKSGQAAVLDRKIRDLETTSAKWEGQHQSQISALEAQVKVLQQQSSTLSQVPCGDDLQAICPLLAGARRAADQVLALTAQLESLRQQINPHEDSLVDAMMERDSLEYDPAAHGRARAELQKVQADAQQLPVLEAAITQVQVLTERRTALLADHVAKGREIDALTLRRLEVAAGVADTADLRKAHQAAQTELNAARGRAVAATEQLAGLRKSLEEATLQATRAEERIQALNAKMVELTGRMVTIDQHQAELQVKRNTAEGDLAALDDVAEQLAVEQRVQTDARAQENSVRERLGRLQQELTEIQASESLIQEAKAKIAAAERQALVYEVLDQASSQKSGVPALLIEAAVPQIEELANTMLSRMAGGRLAIRLDTQVEGKSTGTNQEVLRITVLNSGAPREYITFSGGERFMVDLCLRVALSKFLAHRAGAEVRLLVIDEGMGTLDEANRHEVMEAIKEASKEFAVTLVSTHIPELQDLLPQRIEVARGDNGSTIRWAA